jgi:hypothetical protein
MNYDIPTDTHLIPPWSGPAGVAMAVGQVPIARNLQKNSANRPANFPYADAKEQNPNLFPPVCLRSHWDPTMICARVLPDAQVATPLDPRPWTKVCLNYVTSQEFEEPPRPSDQVVYPSGGTVYPPSRYKEAIDKESELRRLDRPLGTCERDQYIPPRTGNMYRPNATVPDKQQEPNSRFISELAFPQACMRAAPYDCRQQAEEAAWNRSPMPFNNATKQSRYAIQRRDLVRQPPPPEPQEKRRLS